MPQPNTSSPPVWSGWQAPMQFSGERSGLRGSPVLAIGGLVALIFVGIPMYQYAIPLWATLYPLAAVGTLLVYAGVTMGLKEFIFAAASAFIAAWPLTLGEHMLSGGNKGYWMLRHIVRLGLLFVWATYALTLRQMNAQHIPDITRWGLPHMIVSPTNLGLAVVLVVVMHLWLWKFRPGQ